MVNGVFFSKSRKSFDWLSILMSSGISSCATSLGISLDSAIASFLADTAGLEPATSELTAPRTTIVLHVKNWCSYEDLNPEPSDYKSAALPLELYEQLMQIAGSDPQHDYYRP